MQVIFSIGDFYLFGFVNAYMGGWIRVLNKGIHWRHASIPPLFSERNGYRPTVQVGQWRVGLLK